MLDTLEDCGGRDWIPVVCDDVPVDWGKVEFVGNGEDDRPAGSVGWTKEADRSAERVFEDSVTACQLLADAGSSLPGEPGMAHGVVSDGMSGSGDLAGESQLLADKMPNEEEGGADVRCGENVQKLGRGRGVRAIVVGKGELIRLWWSNEDLAEKLRAGP
jgi:hypothetical protein